MRHTRRSYRSTPTRGDGTARRCTNDPKKKAAEVADGMRRFGSYPGMAELYRRGCFRHLEDVAYARIMLERHDSDGQDPLRDGRGVDEIATYLDDSYEGPQRDVKHRCDRVYPPS